MSMLIGLDPDLILQDSGLTPKEELLPSIKVSSFIESVVQQELQQERESKVVKREDKSIGEPKRDATSIHVSKKMVPAKRTRDVSQQGMILILLRPKGTFVIVKF